MFTGIVEQAGRIVSARSVAGGKRLRIDLGRLAERLSPGASVAVDGVCLTAALLEPPHVEFDVIAETLRKTTLGDRGPGDAVNLECSLRVGGPLDGHFVQGHVDGTAEVSDVLSSPKEWLIRLRPQPHLTPYLIPKGSVAVNGVSLTIADVSADEFSVALIPTTLERTTLGGLRVGQRVNVETDLLARTIVHCLGRVSGGRPVDEPITLETLRQAGFA